MLKVLKNDNLVELFAYELERRRSSDLIRAPKSRLVAELAFCQCLNNILQWHLNSIAVDIYEGRHPKHWLWKSHKQWILDRVRPGERILDVGCGASAYLLWMAEKGCIVTGCDVNPERIEQARRLMSHPNLSFEVRDIMKQVPDAPPSSIRSFVRMLLSISMILYQCFVHYRRTHRVFLSLFLPMTTVGRS